MQSTLRKHDHNGKSVPILCAAHALCLILIFIRKAENQSGPSLKKGCGITQKCSKIHTPLE